MKTELLFTTERERHELRVLVEKKELADAILAWENEKLRLYFEEKEMGEDEIFERLQKYIVNKDWEKYEIIQ